MSKTNELRPTVRRHTVNVTAEVIATAARENSSHCMIADAIQKEYPEMKNVSVDISTIRFTDPAKGLRYFFLTPERCRLGLIAFDQGEEITPFEFRMPSATQVKRSQTRTAAYAEKSRRRKQSKREQAKKLVLAHGANIPTRIGGKSPPVGALGKTRRFGMRITSGGRKSPLEQVDGAGEKRTIA